MVPFLRTEKWFDVEGLRVFLVIKYVKGAVHVIIFPEIKCTAILTKLY